MLKLKLYAFQPKGHGQSSFFVIAKNRNEAEKHIFNYIINNYGTIDAYEVRGWGTDYYMVTILDPGYVIENCND